MKPDILNDLMERSGGRVLPNIIFFHPREEFIDYVKAQTAKRCVLDVGAGKGHMAKGLADAGVSVLAIDLNTRDDPEYPVVRANAATFKLPPLAPGVEWLPIMARPCHGLWITMTVKNLLNQCLDVLYVGKAKNLDNDLGDLLEEGFKISIELFGAGDEEELVARISRV